MQDVGYRELTFNTMCLIMLIVQYQRSKAVHKNIYYYDIHI